MQTNFSEDQLKDKDNKSTEKILRKCVHCGMCNATCPTFNLLGDELDGPRGRIYLIKDMIEKKKIPIVKLTIASVILLVIALGFLRFYSGFDPNTEYSPAKYEDGELKPAENK